MSKSALRKLEKRDLNKLAPGQIQNYELFHSLMLSSSSSGNI